ncbi:MAG: DNA-binding domain-containing protein [Pseudomonas sp.]
MNQQTFSRALLSADDSTPSGLTTWNGSDPAARFAVYRNNVQSSLVNALADTFPVVQALVGEVFFRAMAQAFVLAQPPVSRLLVTYGDALPLFTEGFEPARELPYLADVARVELARVQSYHAADATSLTAPEIAEALSHPETLADLRFSLLPSLQVLRSPYAMAALWAAHQGELNIADVDPYRAEQCLVLRPQWDVLVISVDAASANFIQALRSGQPLGHAAAACPADFDLSASLALLIRHGAITALHTP